MCLLVLGRPAGPDNPAALAGDSLPQPVEAAVDPSPTTIQYVGVDHRGLDVLVPAREQAPTETDDSGQSRSLRSTSWAHLATELDHRLTVESSERQRSRGKI